MPEKVGTVTTEAYILREKHGTRVVHAKERGMAALQIIKERIEDDYYWNDFDAEEEWLTVAEQIVKEGNKRWAVQFLEERSDAEYEGYETQTLSFDVEA